jgi:bis(5'-nucleosidyl)-tetraphosphatase
LPRAKSCGAVVYREDAQVKYLLLYYGGDHWDFVKGEVEEGESEEETARRELEEETGLTDAQFIDDFREEISYFFRSAGQTIYKQVVYFLVQVTSSTVKLSYEHAEYTWLDYDEALEKLTFKNARDVLKKAHEFLQKTT